MRRPWQVRLCERVGAAAGVLLVSLLWAAVIVAGMFGSTMLLAWLCR